MKIAHIEYGSRPVFLAPMEDITDLPFRKLCKYFGADMMYTEFIASDALIRDIAKTKQKVIFDETERPIGIQLYGHLVDPMIEAARIATSYSPDLIDINYGCPVRKIAMRGAGSGMLRDLPKMELMTKGIVNATHLPVTAKTRLGWDHESKNILYVSEMLQDCGIQALTIHGRTRSQLYTGTADWTLIAEVKNNQRMHIPIIGNGDIDSAEKAKLMFDTYGVDAIMIGRAVVGRPWIFREVKHYLQTGEILAPPSIAERVEIARMHLAEVLNIRPEKSAIMGMRRHFVGYFKGLKNFKDFKIRLLTTLNLDEIHEILNEVAMHHFE